MICRRRAVVRHGGTAYRIQNVTGGWGQIKVVLDQKEHHRIEEVKERYYPGGRRHHWKPIIDGQRGLFLLKAKDRYYVEISWGDKDRVEGI